MWFTCQTPCNYLRKKSWHCLPRTETACHRFNFWKINVFYLLWNTQNHCRFDQIGTFGLDFQSCLIIFAMPEGSRHTWVIPRTPTPKYESTTLEMLALPMRVCAGLVKVVLCSLRTSSFGGFFKPSRCPFLLETMLLCWLGVSLYRTQDEVYWSVQKSPVCWTLPGYSSSGDRKIRCGRKVT